MIPVLYLVFNLIYSCLAFQPDSLPTARKCHGAQIGSLSSPSRMPGWRWRGRKSRPGVFAVTLLQGHADGKSRALLAEFTPGEATGTAFGAYHMVVG
jgi:MFS-type transporter involved in bile tolerance (Atg22 family)